MTLDQLLTHFDYICDAPDAIPRIRQFILELAVRGKLVVQDPQDEPASELLKSIQDEKARLVKTGEIPKEKPLPLVEQDEAPFEAPAGWEWVRIRQVTSDRGQTIPDKDFTYIDVTAINKEAGRLAAARVLSASEAPSRARKLVETGDVLYSCVRPYLLNIAIVENDIIPSPIASTAFAILNGFGLVLSKYLWIALRSPFMVECVEAKMRGQAYPAINDSDFALLPLPLPPLAEQYRIIAKVDKLMALCDRMEAAQADGDRWRELLSVTSLHRLNNGAEAADFREHVRFYLHHLPLFTTRPEQIPTLRQTIINLAVRGKLVQQNPNDQPVSELLKSIQAEKARLIMEKNRGDNSLIQTQLDIQPVARSDFDDSTLPAIQEDQMPFRLPAQWQWVQFGEVIIDADAGWSPRSELFPRSGDNWGVLKVSAVSWDKFLPNENKQLLPGVIPPEATQVHAGDFLISRANTKELVAKCVVVDEEPRNLILSDKIVRLHISEKCSKKYLCIVNNYAEYARSYYAEKASGTSLSIKTCRDLSSTHFSFLFHPSQNNIALLQKSKNSLERDQKPRRMVS